MTNAPWGGATPNSPGQYPGRPLNSPQPFHKPGCRYGGPCYCFRPPDVVYTAEQDKAQYRVNLLRIINLVLFLPFLGSISWFLLLDTEPRNYGGLVFFKTLAGIAILLILALVITNKVVRYRLKRKYNVR
jgi:hypothetical protein